MKLGLSCGNLEKEAVRALESWATGRYSTPVEIGEFEGKPVLVLGESFPTFGAGRAQIEKFKDDARELTRGNFEICVDRDGPCKCVSRAAYPAEIERKLESLCDQIANVTQSVTAAIDRVTGEMEQVRSRI